MSNPTLQADAPTTDLRSRAGLRLWPAVAIILVLWAVRGWASTLGTLPSHFFFGLVLAPVAALLALQMWWLFASRLRWMDRLAGFVVFFAVAAATVVIAGDNFPGMALILYALPLAESLWVIWLVISIPLAWPVRRAGVLLTFVLTGLLFTLIRVDGMDGSFAAKFNWRWTPTPEAKLMSELKVAPKAVVPATGTPAADLVLQAGDWPGFRGPERDSRLTGVRIRTDWDAAPPREVWRHRIGPGWSSCSVIGDRLFTQEQRGDDEFVVCYDAGTGTEVWSHRDPTRFFEVVAGAGPRGTPTFHEGRIYALGANGNLNCLNAATGKLEWTRNLVAESQAKVPQWGFSSSPLVMHGLVSVFAGGPDHKAVLAYKIESGELAWAAGDGVLSYCSPQPATIGGVEQLLITTETGLTSFDPATGAVLWQNPWPVDGIARVVQPAIIGGTDVLIGTGMGVGTRRITVDHTAENWNVKEDWTSRTIKPYFNDFVVVGEHLYGFDGNIFMCVSLADGKLVWRARGYGNGQVLLLADEALLLVLTEQGEVVLVEAQPGKHKELGRLKAIEGKTWNHPVIAHGKLFVRNAEEIACFALQAAPEIASSEFTDGSRQVVLDDLPAGR
jgi:outer membrane protein assembly factor BamB